jgi:5-methylcytosine-specific restriction protein A
MTWQGHPRTTTPQWRTTRRQALDRDGHRCVMCGQPSNITDHIVNYAAGGTDDVDNLQTLCTTHHQAKTQAEATAARWRHKATRDAETHPGLK